MSEAGSAASESPMRQLGTRGLVVAVGDWYARTLAVTLPAAMRHLAECLVVTTAEDEAVKAVVAGVPGARVFETDAFTRPDANGVRPHFNKGLSVEEAFDVLGRHGWLCILDADILLPPRIDLSRLHPNGINGARRRIAADWGDGWDPATPWASCPIHKDGGPIGFFQLFRAEAPAIAGRRPWYDVSFGHAGGCDAHFLDLFPGAFRRVLPIETLHLGQVDTHWFGTDRDSIDLMAKFVTQNGWRTAAQLHDPEAAKRAGEVVHRVEVPGYEPSNYELPFVRRSKDRAKVNAACARRPRT